MAYTRNYYPRFNFLLTQCSGVIDDQSLLIHLMSLSNESKGFSYIRELVDVRYLRNSSKITANGLVHNAKIFHKLFSQIKICSAVLINTPEDRKPAEIYLQMFTSPTMTFKVFEKDIDEPLGWLGYAKDDAMKIKRFIAKHTTLSKTLIAKFLQA